MKPDPLAISRVISWSIEAERFDADTADLVIASTANRTLLMLDAGEPIHQDRVDELYALGEQVGALALRTPGPTRLVLALESLGSILVATALDIAARAAEAER